MLVSKGKLFLKYQKTRVLLSASLDYSVILWSLDTQFPITKFNHSSNVTSVSFCPFEEQDGDQYFVSGCMDKYIRIWSSKTGKVISYSNMEEYITSVCYFPTGDRVAIGTHNGKCAIYDCKVIFN
jgi:WD40 repeat protein